MRTPVFAVMAVTVIVVALVLAIAIGAGSQRSNSVADTEIALLVNSFELSRCDDLSPVGTMKVTREGTVEQTSAYTAGSQCVAELRGAAGLRGFADTAEGELELEVMPGRTETLRLYPEEVAGRQSFEWVRTRQ